MRNVLLLLLLATAAPAAKFYSDDPLDREPPPRNVTNALRRKVSDYYDFVLNTFASPGEKHAPGKSVPAQAVNTLGEPMDGAWYTRRHYYSPMSIPDLVRGPGHENAPSTAGKWIVVKAKSEGVTPGFEFVDPNKRRYVLKFDPLEYPEIATAPDVLVSKFFYALGYHVPENYIVHFTRDQLELGPDVELVDAKGKSRKMTSRDVTELLIRVPKDRQGRYRGGASLFLKGKPLGPYKYHGLRRDDPNDTVRHEHRRDLRGLSVFCAWLGHDDSRAINSLDMLVEENGVSSIRHHLIDFGSTLGSASYGPNSPRSGFEYIFEWKPAIRQFLTLGLAPPPWALAKFPHYPSVGRFEGDRFDAAGWVAEYPNPAFTNRLPADAFWAAKQVMAFTGEQIRAIVKTGEFSDPAAEQYVADTLIKRRDKIGKDFFAQVLPLDRFAVNDGRLTFDNLAVVHKLSAAPAYTYQWSVFDNGTETCSPLGGRTGPEVPSAAASYLVCDIHAGDTSKTVSVYLRDGRVAGIGR